MLLAQRIAPHLCVGQQVYLSGPIGAGKSVFARALIHSLQKQKEEVPSPTFTLVQTYETPHFNIWHCDFYRLDHVDPLGELGLWEAFETALCLIEWPERLTMKPEQDFVDISIKVLPRTDLRSITVQTDIKTVANALKAEA